MTKAAKPGAWIKTEHIASLVGVGFLVLVAAFAFPAWTGTATVCYTPAASGAQKTCQAFAPISISTLSNQHVGSNPGLFENYPVVNQLYGATGTIALAAVFLGVAAIFVGARKDISKAMRERHLLGMADMDPARCVRMVALVGGAALLVSCVLAFSLFGSASTMSSDSGPLHYYTQDQNLTSGTSTYSYALQGTYSYAMSQPFPESYGIGTWMLLAGTALMTAGLLLAVVLFLRGPRVYTGWWLDDDEAERISAGTQTLLPMRKDGRVGTHFGRPGKEYKTIAVRHYTELDAVSGKYAELGFGTPLEAAGYFGRSFRMGYRPDREILLAEFEPLQAKKDEGAAS